MNRKERKGKDLISSIPSAIYCLGRSKYLFHYLSSLGLSVSKPLRFKLKKHCLMCSECWIKLKPFPYQGCFHVGIVCACVFMLMGMHTRVFLCVWQGTELLPFLEAPPGAGEHLQPSLFHMPRASQSHSIINSGWLWINKLPSLFFLSDQPDLSSLCLWFRH